MQPKPSRSLITNTPHKVTILVVENDATTRLLMEVMLKRDGFHVILATDSTEASNAMKNQRIHGMILGTLMTGMGAMDFCKALRADSETVGLPILMLLSSNDPTSVVRSKQAGANDQLVKPVIAAELIRKIRQILRRDG